jgi:hypothetical protein
MIDRSGFKVIYNEEDQRKIADLDKKITNYEFDLMHRINRDGLNWAASSEEMKAEFINDEVRISLLKSKVDLISSMIPCYQVLIGKPLCQS